jgi:thiamine-phosphate pyrophosphorylase
MINAMKISKEVALEITKLHAGMLAGEPVDYEQAVHPSDASLHTYTAGLLQGCRMLGFLEHDAQCVINAWNAQTQRIGYFSINDWPCHPEDFGVALSPRTNAFLKCPHALGLYAVLPDAKWVERMVYAGVQ